MNLWNDLDSFLPIYTKLNALAECLKIAETDEVITAGAVTTIPVVALAKNMLIPDSIVVMIDKTTGAAYELELTAGATAGANSLTVTSYTFLSDVAAGSGIYVRVLDLLHILYPV